MRFLEVILMTLAGVWQGIRQDFNLLELALIAVGFWLWKRRLLVGRTPWSAAGPLARLKMARSSNKNTHRTIESRLKNP